MNPRQVKADLLADRRPAKAKTRHDVGQPPTTSRATGGRAGGWRAACGPLLATLVWVAPILSGCQPALSDHEPDVAGFHLRLAKQDEFALEDPDRPVQYLAQLTTLPDGGWLAVDIVAGLVRRFDEQGRIVGRIGPPAEEGADWRPLSAAVGNGGDSVWVSDTRGRLWRFGDFGQGEASQVATHPDLIVFSLSPKGDIVARRPFADGELHLFRNGAPVRGFLESDPFNRSLSAKNFPAVTFDGQGNIFAIRFLDPTVFMFSPEGEEVRRWRLLENRDFKEFPLGIDPYATTRDRNLILAWQRTFTTFPGIVWLGDARIAVLSANDPPKRPNVLSLYTTAGKHLGSAEVSGYLVAARGRDLYFTDQYLFFKGPCRIARYSLAD